VEIDYSMGKSKVPTVKHGNYKPTKTDVEYLEEAVDYVKDCDKTKRKAKDRVSVTFIISMLMSLGLAFIFILYREEIFGEVDLWVEILIYVAVFLIIPVVIPLFVHDKYKPEMYQKCIAKTPSGDYVEL
jgi:SNF family Na+-dependent transporter